MLRLAFLASNNGSAMRGIVAAIAAGRLAAEPCLVISNKPAAPALMFAAAGGIPTAVIPTLPDAAAADAALKAALTAAAPSLVILSGYLRKLGPQTLAAYAGRILNTHPALLPKYGGPGMYGRRVHEAVHAAGEAQTGITIHHADSIYDHGAIIAQKIIDIPYGADTRTIERLVLEAEPEFFVQTLINMERKRFFCEQK